MGIAMYVLLTNDDGISAPGLQALYQILSENGEVAVVAPDQEKSAVGHGITLNHPIRVTELPLVDGKTGYAVSGTPADCVKLAFLEILDKKPDIVISGINRGANLGVNINYSGTAAAAREAALYRTIAIAASVQGQRGGDFHGAARYIRHLSLETLKNGLPPMTFLNVNFPALPLSEMAGVRICRQGLSFPDEYLDRRKDPRGKTYYWHGCDFKNTETDIAIDSAAVEKRFISITPIKCDMTDYEAIPGLESWQILNGNSAINR
jgi:5'-nucleotidase